MPNITFQGTSYRLREGETLLEGLTGQGVSLPSSCRNGVCQTCLMRSLEGTPPPQAQHGLKDTLRAQNYFLPCICKPETDMEIALPGEDAVCRVTARVVGRELLNADILRLRLLPEMPFPYRAGQFVQLHREDGLVRSYSLASLPDETEELELHVRRLPGGAMSEWLHQDVQVGDSLTVAGPAGNCFYIEGKPEQGILLIATGSGLAPLWGIVRDALRQGHRGPITLFHGSWTPEGLYLTQDLRRLAREYPQFTYAPCVDTEATDGLLAGRADQNAFAAQRDLKGWRVFLCGHPDMVAGAKKKAYLSGASLGEIYADPFVLSARTVSPAPSR